MSRMIKKIGYYYDKAIKYLSSSKKKKEKDDEIDINEHENKIKINPILKITNYITNDKFNKGEEEKDQNTSMKKVNSSFDNSCSLSLKRKIINYNDYENEFVNPIKKQKLDNSSEINQTSKNLSSAIETIQKEDPDLNTIQTIHTNFNYNNKDVKPSSLPVNTIGSWLSIQSVVNKLNDHDINKLDTQAIKQKQTDIQKKREENASKLNSILSFRQSENENISYEEKKNIMDKYYKEKAKNYYGFELDMKSSNNNSQENKSFGTLSYMNTEPVFLKGIKSFNKNTFSRTKEVNFNSAAFSKSIKKKESNI